MRWLGEMWTVRSSVSALAALETVRYAYIVIDLEHSRDPSLQQPLAALGSEFFRYPGLMAARRARTTGHNTHQVIIYSVHDFADVDAYAELILSKYILKGRPRELKHHIESTMKRIPTGWTSTKPPDKRLRRAKVVARNKPRPPKKAAAAQKEKTFFGRYPTFVTAIKKKSTAKSEPAKARSVSGAPLPGNGIFRPETKRPKRLWKDLR